MLNLNTYQTPRPFLVQIVEARRILQWTYAYGYYKFDIPATDVVMSQQRHFFEFLQVGQAGRSMMMGLLMMAMMMVVVVMVALTLMVVVMVALTMV